MRHTIRHRLADGRIARWVLQRLVWLMLVVGAGSLGVSLWLQQSRLDKFDEHQYRSELARVTTVVDSESAALGATVTDYAHWVETYQFLAVGSRTYLRDNFTPANLMLARVDGVMILPHTGPPAVALAVVDGERMETMSGARRDELVALVRGVPIDADSVVRRVVWIEGRPVLVAVALVTNPAGGPGLVPNGRLAMFRHLGSAYASHVSDLTAVDFVFERPPPGKGNGVAIRRDGALWHARSVVFDGAICVSIDGPSRIAEERVFATRTLIGNAVGWAALLLAAVYFVLDRRVLRRLTTFAELAHAQGRSGALDVRWPVQGKDEIDTLADALNRLVSEVETQHGELQRLALVDQLTGLPNRRSVMATLRRAMAVRKRDGRERALMFLDLDHFKEVNDTLGHEWGDALLIEAARRLRAAVREVDTVARLGGDEFVVLLEGLGGEVTAAGTHAERIAEKIADALAAPFTLDAKPVVIGASIGVALLGDEDDVDVLIKRADMAMFEAKSAGRGRVRFFDPDMQARVDARLVLEADLRAAVADNQFVVHYQPQVDAAGRPVGAEALVRWAHPTRGLVMPGEFIVAAEEAGLIVDIGRQVLDAACRQLQAWQADPALAGLVVSVNVSAAQFQHGCFVHDARVLLRETGVDASRLKLELTESMLVTNAEGVAATMAELRGLGIQFSLDDFGTGYSSLSYLKRLPLTQLKIDRSFVTDVDSDANDLAIAKTIVALADSLGLGVIAEGVETVAQRDRLAQIGCHVYQGYLFHRPMPADELARVVGG